MKRTLVIVVAASLCAAQPANAWFGGLLKLFGRSSKPAVKAAGMASKTAAGEATAFKIMTATDEAAQAFRWTPEGEIQLLDEAVPASLLGKQKRVNQVLAAWPESTHVIIQRAEKLNLELKAASLKNFRQIATDIIASNATKIIREAGKYPLSLALNHAELHQAQRILQELKKARMLELGGVLDSASLGSVESYLTKLEDMHGTIATLDTEYRATGASMLSNYKTGYPSPPEMWDETSWVGYLLNRRMIYDGHLEEAQKLLLELKPLRTKFRHAEGLSHWQKEPMKISETADFSAVFEQSVKNGIKRKPERFRILAPTREAASGFEATRKITETSLDDVLVLNLLPRRKTEVAPWTGYLSGDLDSYVEWGQRIEMTLQKRQVSTIAETSVPAQVIEQVKKQAAQKKVLVIIGEAYDQSYLRLPGAERVSVKALRDALPKDVQLVGLFCGSADALGQVPGLAVHGKMQASEAAGILRSLITNVNPVKPLTVGDIIPVMAGMVKVSGELVHDAFLYLRNNEQMLIVIGSVSVGGGILLTQEKEPQPVQDKERDGTTKP